MNVGIDLGTTYSLIARLEEDGTTTLLPDHNDPTLVHTPSVVHISGDGALVGHLVDVVAEENPDLKAIRFFKRNLGEPKPIFFDDTGSAWFAESITALLLKKLMFDAESFTSSGIDGAVITVPAHFNDVQRKAVLASAGLAELKVLGLLEEPVAAALHYGISHAAQDQILLVYDLGGGTFDATVLSLDARGVYVLSKEGMTNLGGKEFDEKIGEIILECFARTGLAPTLNARTLLQLRRISEEIKFELCMPNKTHDRRVVLLGSQSVEVRIAREDFERRISDALSETVEVALRCVAGAGLKLQDITAVLLVGGSSLIPAVSERMRKLLGTRTERVRFHEPTRAVVYGAALHSAQLTGNAEQYSLPAELRGVTGYHIGVRIIDPRTGRIRIDPLIKKNMPLPARTQKTYYTAYENQERIVLDIVQYLSPDDDITGVGQLVVGPLPSPRQNYPIDVILENCEDGTINIRAFDPQSGMELQQTFGRQGTDVFGHLAAQRMLVKSTVINSL